MDARPPASDGERLDSRVEVLDASSRERGNRRLGDRRADCADALEVAGRGVREAGLDHVDAEALERQRDLDLLVG